MRTAQRMSGAYSGGSGQETEASSIESALPRSTATQTKLTVQAPRLTLSRSHSLPDKTQLTLVAMMQRPPPPASPPAAARLDKEQKGSPPHPTFLLDKGHLLSFWRCALPLGRMKEVTNILEFVFTQRETQAAKAALALASRRRPAPRTTPTFRRTRATRNTTPATQGHAPATPHDAASLPTTPQSPADHGNTPHVALHDSTTPSLASHQCSTPQSSASQPSVSPCSEARQCTTPQTDPHDLSSPNANSSHHSSPRSSSCPSESKSCRRDAQGQDSPPRQAPSSPPSQPQQPTAADGVYNEASPPITRSSSHTEASKVGTLSIRGNLSPRSFSFKFCSGRMSRFL